MGSFTPFCFRRSLNHNCSKAVLVVPRSTSGPFKACACFQLALPSGFQGSLRCRALAGQERSESLSSRAQHLRRPSCGERIALAAPRRPAECRGGTHTCSALQSPSQARAGVSPGQDTTTHHSTSLTNDGPQRQQGKSQAGSLHIKARMWLIPSCQRNCSGKSSPSPSNDQEESRDREPCTGCMQHVYGSGPRSSSVTGPCSP